MKPFETAFNTLLVDTYRSIGKIEEVMLRSISSGTLSVSEMHMLDVIGRRKNEGSTITEIAESLGITLPSVTAAIKRLEQKGYVTKEKSASDGRQVCVKLTEIGLRADVAHRYFHRQMVRSIEKALPDKDRDELMRIAQALNDFFRQKEDEIDLKQLPKSALLFKTGKMRAAAMGLPVFDEDEGSKNH